MKKEDATKMAVFVGVLIFGAVSYTLTLLFDRMGPEGSELGAIKDFLSIMPFVLGAGFGLFAFAIAKAAFRIAADEKDTSDSEENSENKAQ